jgi:hypothetical protein
MKNCLISKCINFSTYLALISVVNLNLVIADVRFRSIPTTVKTFENDSALLPCYPTIPYRSIRWIFEDFFIIDINYPDVRPNDRTVLHSNGSLEVFDLKLNDTGEYVCEVEANNGHLIHQKHAIEVQCK